LSCSAAPAGSPSSRTPACTAIAAPTTPGCPTTSSRQWRQRAHPDHTPAHRDRYTDLARALGLVVTAGSDYHGAAKENRLGSATTERDVVEALRGRLG
jgi:hypothetical protein